MSADTIDDHKARSDAEIEAHRDELLSLSHDIWNHPELCYAEAHAHDVLTGALDRHGFRVERGAFGLETAFAAELQTPRANGPRVAIICEYDALPGLGHACGHNIIASSGLGAALGAAAVASALGGRLVVFVTPADENGSVNVIVWKSLREKQRSELLQARLMAVWGVWQRDVESGGEVRPLIAQRLVDLTPLLGGLATRSREFH